MRRFLRGGTRVLAFVAAPALLGACTEYLDRKETVAYSAGSAVAHNQVMHTIDPWPAHAKDTAILSSGERAARAVERYENCYLALPDREEVIARVVCVERSVEGIGPPRGGGGGAGGG
jgi:hypothetical protein